MADGISVLFTSAGRRVALLQAFRRAYEGLTLDGRIIVTDVDPLAPSFQVADASYLVPLTSDRHFVPALAKICERERIQLVFPLTDTDIPVLAAHKEELEATGARVVVVSPEWADTTRDKWKTYLFFRCHGIPTPATWLPEQVHESSPGFPLFVKPRAGSAGKFAFTARDAQQLSFFLGYAPDPIVQEYLDGPEITTDVVSDFEGKVLGAVSRERIEVRSGEVAKGRTVFNETVLRLSVEISTLMGAVGPITVQCILKDGKPRFTEVNARFGGGSPLGFAAGVNSPKWLLALAAGMEPDIPPLGTYTRNLYLTRYDGSFFLTDDQYAAAKSSSLRP